LHESLLKSFSAGRFKERSCFVIVVGLLLILICFWCWTC